LSSGADDADLFFEHSQSNAVALSDGKVIRASTHVDLGVGIRVVVGDSVGYAYTEDLSLDSMIRAAQVAAQIAAGKTAHRPVAMPMLRTYADRYAIQRPWDQVGMEQRVSMVREWEQRTFSLDPRVKKVEVSLADSTRHVLVCRPDGRLVPDSQCMTRAFVVCTAEENGRRESASYNLAHRDDLSFYTAERTERLCRKAVANTTILFEAVKPPAGEMTVVLGAGSSGILLHEAIGHGLEADFNRKGVSIYADQVGKRIAPPGVTVVDDGTLPHNRGAINADDEGNPA